MKSALKSTRVGSVLNQFGYLPAKAWLTFRVLKKAPAGTLLVDDERVFSVFNVWGNDKVHAQDGLLITLHLLATVFDKAVAAGVCPMLLLLPSKENLLLEYLQDRGYALPAGFILSVAAEREFARQLADLALQHGVTPIDPRPDLLEAFRTAGPLYPADLDGHPFAKGYAAYALALQRYLSVLPCASQDVRG